MVKFIDEERGELQSLTQDPLFQTHITSTLFKKKI